MSTGTNHISPVQLRRTIHAALPFAHLNLRRNPFGEVDFADRGRIAVADVDDLVERLRQPGFAVQFLGACGRGKTTHLLALKESFADAPYVYIPEPPAARPPIPPGEVLFLDEAQRVPRRMRRKLFREKRAFAIGSHEDHGDELKAAGLDVCTIEPARRLSEERLVTMLNARIESVRREDGRIPRVLPETGRTLMQQFGCNIRAMEHHLYEVFQSMDKLSDA